MVSREALGIEVVRDEALTCEVFAVLFVVTRKFCKKSFPIFDVLPVLGVEFNGNHTAGRNMFDTLVSKFIYKIIDPMIMAEYNGRVKPIIKSLNCFD